MIVIYILLIIPAVMAYLTAIEKKTKNTYSKSKPKIERIPYNMYYKTQLPKNMRKKMSWEDIRFIRRQRYINKLRGIK